MNAGPGRKRSRLLIKLLIGAGVLVVVGYLFIHSLETTRSEPYTIEARHLGKWTLVLEPAEGPDSPMLSVRTSIELVANLFRQLFHRAMESMNTPSNSSIPIVLHGEYERGLSRKMTPDDLLALAREAGLESAAHEPRCLAHRRISEPRMTRQTYFAIVDSPSIVAFREKLAWDGQGQFDAAALTPIMFVGASEPAFHRWLPIRADESDCVSPIEAR